MLIKSHGTVLVFRIYGLVCAIVLILFVLVNFFNRNEGSFSADLPDDIDPRNVMNIDNSLLIFLIEHCFQLAEESAHLAPHGVPGGAMPRALSSSKLEEQNAAPQEQYGDNLNLPAGSGGANNPFMQDGGNYSYTADGRRIEGNQGQYYGAGYSQAQSSYSSSGFGETLTFFLFPAYLLNDFIPGLQ